MAKVRYLDILSFECPCMDVYLVPELGSCVLFLLYSMSPVHFFVRRIREIDWNSLSSYFISLENESIPFLSLC